MYLLEPPNGVPHIHKPSLNRLGYHPPVDQFRQDNRRDNPSYINIEVSTHNCLEGFGASSVLVPSVR